MEMESFSFGGSRGWAGTCSVMHAAVRDTVPAARCRWSQRRKPNVRLAPNRLAESSATLRVRGRASNLVDYSTLARAPTTRTLSRVRAFATADGECITAFASICIWLILGRMSGIRNNAVNMARNTLIEIVRAKCAHGAKK